jgi:hypothetical protein
MQAEKRLLACYEGTGINFGRDPMFRRHAQMDTDHANRIDRRRASMRRYSLK